MKIKKIINIKKLWTQLLLGFLIFILDRITKFWAVKYLAETIPVFSFFNFIKLDFELAFNHGVSWGLFSTNNLLARLGLVIVITAILSFLIFYTGKKLQTKKSILGEILIIAGAVSNLLDRFFYGAVIDFIHVSFNSFNFNNLSWDFPIFNLADVGIFMGVCYLLFREYYPEKL